jgi:hypothetical protein
MARYNNLVAGDIGLVLQVKLGPYYIVRNPSIQAIGPKCVFKAMIITGVEPARHYMYFVSNISDKDMDDWLERAVKRIGHYMATTRVPVQKGSLGLLV